MWREAGRQCKREQTTDRAASTEEKGFGSGEKRVQEAHGLVSYPILPYKNEVHLPSSRNKITSDYQEKEKTLTIPQLAFNP